MRVKELVAFIKAREGVRLNKEARKPREQWTKDPILAKYRFCNVRREDDRVTRELKEIAFISGAQWEEPDKWFWWVAARLFNKPETMREITTFVEPFQPDKLRKRLKQLREEGPIFNGAYIVSTNGKAMDKVDYLIDFVLKPLWKDRKSIRPHKQDQLESWHQKLTMYDGLGSFMAAQIVADMKYVEPLENATDWWTFAASGPGSRRGLNRVMGWDPHTPWNETVWRAHLTTLRKAVNHKLEKTPIGGLHAQDLQNCLCEFDKYERARLGEEPPKQIYKEKR